MYYIFPRANKIVSRSHKPKLTAIRIFEEKEEHTARREVEPCAFAFVEFSYKTMDTTSFCKLRQKSEVGALKISCSCGHSHARNAFASANVVLLYNEP